MPLSSTNNSPPEQSESGPLKKKVSLKDLMDRYKETPLGNVSRRFQEEFFTPAAAALFTTFAGDTSLRFAVVADEQISTAAINPKTGQVMIGKSLAQACLEGERKNDVTFNHTLLRFIFAHEIGHYKDLCHGGDKPIGFSQKLKRFQEWNDRLNQKIWDTWENDFGAFHKGKVERGENRACPLHFLYHEFFNKLDDTLVNRRAQKGFKSLRPGSFQLPDFYEYTLFQSTSYNRMNTPLCGQLGNYLLQKIETPHLQIEVDPEVQAELEVQYDFNGKKQTLLQILAYLSDKFDSQYAAIRYPDKYEKYFLPAFERLLKKDREFNERLQDFMEQLEKQQDQNGEQPQSGQGPAGSPNPFSRRSQEIADKAREAEKNDQGRIKDRQAKNKEESKSDQQKAEDQMRKQAASFAGERSLPLEKTQRYFELRAEFEPEIEELSDFIVHILLRNKTTAVSILEKRQKSGNLLVKNLIKKYAGIISGDKEATRVFERKITTDTYRPRNIGMMFRMVIDNSGSMRTLMPELEGVFVIITHAIRRAQQMLIQTYHLPEVRLQSQMILFGNARQEGDPHSGARLIKPGSSPDQEEGDFDAELIQALGHITCNEGTEDSDAWKLIGEELFDPGEVEVEGDNESISASLEVTDGFTEHPERTRLYLETIQELGIHPRCAYIENNQPLDQSLSDRTRSIREEMASAYQNPARMQELQEQLRSVEQQWYLQNEQLLENNPSTEVWGDRMSIMKDTRDILPLVEIMLMEAVNQVDEQLEQNQHFSLTGHFTEKALQRGKDAAN